MITLVGTCLELIRYLHQILKVNEVKQRRNELLIGYMTVILWAMRSRYLLYYSGYDKKNVFWLQLNALIYAGSIYFFLRITLHANPRMPTPRYSEFTETRIYLVVAHFYVIFTAMDIGNWLQVFSWIISLASSIHIHEILTSQRPEPAPVAPAAITNIRDRPEARAEVPDNQEEKGKVRIQAVSSIRDQLDEREILVREMMTDLARNRAAAPATDPEASENPAVPPNVLTTRKYLETTVVPILLQGLRALAKTRPEYPIEFLANFLWRERDHYKNQNRAEPIAEEHDKILMSQRPEPAPAAPAATTNIRKRPEERAEVPDNQEDEEKLGARIQAAWWPRGQSIEEKNQRCFELLIQRFKNAASPFEIRNALKRMEEKRRHRDQRNELFGLPNILKDHDFFDDLEYVTGIKRCRNLSVSIQLEPFIVTTLLVLGVFEYARFAVNKVMF
ncbi:hypothetical protein GCK72_011326 [Caenorhabditis remanei]|uniref:Uncharacterized protein n=1 Tax=Caenorhabditis remanei TaxID=31234 RepID=A0A6A5H873_CAERE|nr:hypothetical protein GCK72_011326 [Caenorhabditis remanei]KAF1763061.1 hypothetical protein GCK72_011326 [Caenorhabditis remanei]